MCWPLRDRGGKVVDCVDHGRSVPRYANARYKGTFQKLHRLVWCEHNGVEVSSIVGMVVRHTCDNPRCINPLHLILGTQAQNVQDAIDRGRWPSGEKSGNAEATEEVVIFIREHYIPRDRQWGGRALAKQLNLHPSTVRNIITNSTWKRV